MERRRENAGDPKYSITVSAPTNADAHRLSLAIREQRRQAGELGRDLVKVSAADRDGNNYEMAIAVGDKVRLFNSVSAQGQRGGSIGRNGSILTVQSADNDGMTVTNAKGTTGFVPWKTLTKDGQVRLAYGEVMTTHTAQGSTSTEHIYSMPSGTRLVTGFSAYSSGTRHRNQSFMVISEGAERAEVAARRPVNDPRPVRTDDLWSNVSRNLGKQPVKTTAVDFLDNSFGVKRGSAGALQQGLQPRELRKQQGRGPTTFHTLQQQRQQAHAIGRLSGSLETIGKTLKPVVDRLAIVERNVRTVKKGLNRSIGPTMTKSHKRSLSRGITH
jgi:hypothetical protein